MSGSTPSDQQAEAWIQAMTVGAPMVQTPNLVYQALMRAQGGGREEQYVRDGTFRSRIYFCACEVCACHPALTLSSSQTARSDEQGRVNPPLLTVGRD